MEIRERTSKEKILNNIKKVVTSKAFVTICWILLLVIIWEIVASVVATTRRIPEYVLPHLSGVFKSIFDDKIVAQGQTITQFVMSNAAITLSRAFSGFLIGVIAGFLLALLMNITGIIEKIAFPYLMILQMIPILGMAPIIFAITKDIDKSRTIIAAILTFYPVAINTLAGFKSVEPEKHDLMKICAANKVTVYVKTLIPACIPSFFTGLKIAAPMAITASILVDTLQGGGGLGNVLSQALRHAMDIYVFWQIVFLSAIIGILSVLVMRCLEYLLSPQKHGLRKFADKVKSVSKKRRKVEE